MKKTITKRSTPRMKSDKPISKLKNSNVRKAVAKKAIEKKSTLNIRTQKNLKTINMGKVKEFAQEAKAGVLDKIPNLVSQASFLNLDSSLLKISPQLQATVDSLITKIEKTPAGIQDLQALATRVLKHAVEISETLKKKVTKKN